jgi:alpha-glucosidase
MPWGDVDAAAPTIDLYSDLIHLRTGHTALNGGGMRWLHAGREVLVFVRESAAESILVVAARGDFDISLPTHAFAGVPAPLYGPATVARGGSGIRLSGGGPSFSAFALPGVTLPDFAANGSVLELEA